MNALVCTGSPLDARSSSRLNSFRAINELGYDCGNAPLLLTTSSAEYGLLMSLYRGEAHQSLTCCTCSSKRASSAWPAFAASGSSWNESPGRAEDTGGSTGLRMEADIRQAVVERGRRSCGVRFESLRGRVWRAADRAAVRSIARRMCCQQKADCNSLFNQVLRRAEIWQALRSWRATRERISGPRARRGEGQAARWDQSWRICFPR